MKNFNFFEKLWEQGRTLRRVGLVLVMCLIAIPQLWAGAKGFNDNGQWNIRYYRYGASDDWGAASGGYGNGGYIDLGVQTTLELHECWVKTWSNGGDKQKEVCWYYGWTNETMYYGGKATKDSWVEGNLTWNITTTYDMIYWAPNKPGNNTLYMYWRLDDVVSSSTSQIRFVYPGFTGAPSSKDFGSKNVINKDNETTISFTHYGTALTTTCTSEITGDDASMFYVRKIEDGQVTVVFKPTSTGTKTATLTLTDAHGMTCSIDLTGSGVALGTTTRLYFNDYTNHGDWSADGAKYRVTCQYTSGVYTNYPMTLCDNSTYTYYADVELKDGTISKTIDRYNPSSPYVTWNSSNSLSLSSSNPYAISNGKYTAYVANHPFNSTAANLTFYYDNSDSKFTNSLYVIIGRDYVMSTGASGCWSTGYGAMSNVSNTKLYYRTGASALGAWPDATYYAVVGASSAPGNSEWGSSSLSSKGNGGYTNAYTETYDLKSGHYYLAYAPSKTNSAMTITDLGGYAALNCSITIAAKVKPVGGAYTAGATKGALSGSTMKFSSATSCGSSSGASVSVGSTSSVLVAGYTCTKCTLSVSTVADGYTFRGWYDASGTKLSESTSYTGYLPKGDATVYAYFEEDTYTITYNNMTGATNPGSNPSSYTVNSSTITLANPSKSGYGFGGWYSDEDCTTRVKTIAQGSYGNKVLYAKWLTPHEPGYYVSNSPGYNVALTTYSSLKYELYRYAVSSPNYFLCAGETPTTSGVSYNFLNGNKTGSTYHWDANSWIGHTNVYNVSSSSLSAKNEFPAKTAGTLYCRDQQGLVICIKGYKQFSYWGEDASNDSKNEKQFKVYFNGVDSTKGRDDADGGTIRRYTLDSTKTYVIEILGNTDNNNFLYGFSMRPGRPKITSSSLSGAEYAQGASATPLSVTATKLVSSGTSLSYQWYSNTTASNSGGTIIGGATSASYTPPTTSAGTKYYYCVVSETGCNSTTSSVSGAIIVTAACSATAPGSISKGSASGGTGIITLTAAGDPATNNTWYWQSSASGEDKSTSGNTKNVNAAGTYYLRSYCSDNGGCWSDAVLVTVAAADLLTTPTATFSNGVYTIGSSALDLSSLWSSDSEGSVTYSVQSAGSTGASISTAAFTATTAGTATVRASQAANGYYSAIYKDATITVSNPTYSVTYKANNSTAESDVVEDAESTFGDNPSFTVPLTKAFAGWNTKADGSGTHYDVGDAVPSAITVYAEWKYKVLYLTTASTDGDNLYDALKDDYVITVRKPKRAASFDYNDTIALIVLHESIKGDSAKGSDITTREVYQLRTANVPVLNTKSYTYSTNRWEWGTPNAGKVTKCIHVKNSTYANLTSHPIFADLTPDGNDSIQILSSVSSDKKPIQPVGSFTSGKEGYTLATVPNKESGNGAAIHELSATQRGTGASGQYLLISVYEKDLKNLNANGVKLFQNAAKYLISGSAWVPQYAITKSATNGSIATEVNSSAVTSAAAGSRVDITATPTTGYDFSNWSVYKTGDAETTVSVNSTTTSPTYFTMPAYAVTVAATFVESGYTISFEGNGNTGGSMSDVTSITSGSDVTLDENAFTKTGYSFANWTANVDVTVSSSTVDAGDPIADEATIENVTSDITLTAQWTEDTHTVSVEAGAHGTVSPNSVSGVGIATASSEITATPSTGYSFNGWTLPSGVTAASTYTASSNPIKINATADDKAITATWTTVSYTITYELYGGSLDGEKTSYQITDGDYDLPTPTWDGHTFLGWYATYSAGVYSNPVSVLASGSTGNKTYHAKWADGVNVVWTITKVDSKLYAGGGGYSVKAVVDDASWTGDASSLVLSASDGVTLGTPTTSTVSSKKQIVADFSIGCGVEDAITFSLYAPATGVYAAIEDENEVELDACSSGGGSTTVISIFKGTSDGDNTNTKDAVKYEQDEKWTDATTGLASTAKGVKDALYVFASNSWTTANSTVGGTAYTQGIQNGGSNASDNHFKIEIPTGYTAEIYLVAGRAGGSLYLGLNKSAIAPQSGTHADKVWYASYSSSKVLQAWTIEDVPAGTYYLVGNGNDVIFAELKITLTGGSSAIATELSWSGDDASAATAGTVNKNDVDADFTLSATRSTNSIGAITYTSSNTSVATVDEAGKVHIINGGTTTITATLAACGCYGGDEISYSLVVANTCADTPGTIVNDDGSAIAGNAISRGACEALTLRLTGHSGSTIQWKKDGENVGTNSDTYVVPTGVSGVYTATVTGASCTLEATNSITVTTAGVPEPTIFANDFYVKSDKWFGYRLMQINRGETVTVKTAPTGWTVNTDFSITTDASGIVSISGRKAISTPANKTLTLTIDNGCGGSVDKDITIREMAATAQPTIAWIATNNKGGSGQKDNVKADESTNTDLYDHLKNDYIITPRNCYWTTNEADLVKEYSQYDLIILTDYPNSGTCPSGKSGKSNSYTNAIGLLIDHKPIMTFEAFVAGCPNWGIASDPQNTKATQTDLTLLCNADEIFGTDGKFAAGEAITVTSASSGQALQGFPVASSPDFVFIGKITDSDSKTYVACCERQHEIAARMMVFGLNSSIMSSLTEDGKTMVKGFIEYLLKDDPASIPDCSVIFNGEGGDDSWYTTSNWEAGSLPDQYASVRIDAPCVVPENADPAKAGRIKIHVTDMNSGSLTIEPKGRMIVEKTITRIEGNAYTIHMPTEPEDLIIQSDETAQGALIFDNESGTTQATVEMYSKGRYYDGVYNWQYVAVPLVSASRWNMGDWAYCFDNSIGNWTGNDVCPAFSAVGVTRMDAELPTYEFSGPLASTKNQTLTLYTSAAGNDGYNMIGNSWTAPIQIVNFQPGDFGTALYQVNIYNTGHDPEDGPAVEESTDQQGRWKTIPIAATQAAIDAGTWEDLKVIPSMQAFEVQNATGANTTLTLNYDRLVRTLPTEPNLNETKRAPRRTPVERTAVPQMRITLKDETTRENLYLFSGEQFSEGFDNGWDGVYNAGEAGYMQIYMLSPIGNLEISAQPEMEGTTFGFTAGSREVYTFSFKYVGNEELYFNDLKEKKSTLINDENEYTFTAQEGENGIRFMISATPYNSQPITTGMTDLDAEAPQAQKVIYNDKLYIIRGGKVFSADGHLVK